MKVTHILFSLLTLSVSSAWAVSYDADQKIETPLVLDGEYVVEVASGVTVEFSGEISGTGPLRKTGAGTLVLSNGNNTFTEGVQISQGYVRADREGCLGDGRIFIDGTGSSSAPGVTRQIKFNADKATFANEIVVEGWDVGGYSAEACFIATDVETTLAGTVSFSGMTLSSSCNVGIAAGNATSGNKKRDENAVLRFTNDVTAGYLRATAYGTIIFDGKVKVSTLSSAYNSALYGMVKLSSEENQIGGISFASSCVLAAGERALGGATLTVTRAFDTTTRSALDLDGKDQTLASLQFDSSNASYGRDYAAYLLTAAGKPAVLTLVGGTASKTSYQTLAGPLSLVLDAADYPGFTQTLMSRNHDMTGMIAVSNGTLVTSGCTFKKVPEVTVGPKGKLTVSGATSAFAGLTKLVVDGFVDLSAATTPLPSDSTLEIYLGGGEDALLKLPSELRVKNIYVWDAEKSVYGRLPNGDYADGMIPHCSGAAVNVDNGEEEVVEATWTAGGEVNRSIADASNWDVSADKLNLTNGKLDATFASAGETADVDRAVKFLGLAFTRPDGFMLAKANDSAAIQLLDNGLSVTGGGTNEIAAPLTLGVPQAWSVGSDATLLLSGGLSASASAKLCSDGDGEVIFAGEGEIDPGMEISNKFVRVTGTLGTPGHEDQGNPRPWTTGGYTVNPKAFRIFSTKTNGRVVFDGATIEKPLWLHGRGKGDENSGWFNLPSGSTNVFVGSVYFESPIGYLSMDEDSKLICQKGASFGGEVHLASGTLRMEGGSLSANTGNGMYWHANAHLELASSGNTGKFRAYGGKIDILADNAITNAYLYIEQRTPTFTMNGHNIHFSTIDHDYGTPVFVTDAPAGLHVGYNKDAPNSRYSGGLNGPVSLVKSGAAGTLTLGAAFASTGDLTVEGGTNVLTPAASWLTGTNVIVRKTGTLKLQGNRQFNGKFAVLHIDDSGVVELAEGTKQKFHEMYVDGVKVEPGVYGSSEAEGVDHTYAAHFAGKGVVKVGDFGLVLMVR